MDWMNDPVNTADLANHAFDAFRILAGFAFAILVFALAWGD